MTAQSYKNHGRTDPKVHFFLFPLTVACFIASLFHVFHQPSPANVLLVPVTFCMMLTVLFMRMYSLKVQDRVIRLEETLRMKELGIAQDGLTLSQIIALRFASDTELPTLAARAKAESLTGKQIKQSIQNWRGDYHRV